MKKMESEIEIKKAKEMSDIEIKKFKEMTNAIGKDTLVSISKAGPETKAKMLNGLGLKGYLVTDGKNPINLFNTANGFLGGS
jgi:major vault protein